MPDLQVDLKQKRGASWFCFGVQEFDLSAPR